MLGYRPPLWWAFDDEETGDEMSSTPYEEHQLGELRARLAALVNLFPRAVYPHRGLSDYYTIVDKWHEPIVCVTPKYLGPEAVEAARDAILAAPSDIRALLALHDEQQARIAALEAARDALAGRVEALEGALRFYADESSWPDPYHLNFGTGMLGVYANTLIHDDFGDLAREALEGKGS